MYRRDDNFFNDDDNNNNSDDFFSIHDRNDFPEWGVAIDGMYYYEFYRKMPAFQPITGTGPLADRLRAEQADAEYQYSHPQPRKHPPGSVTTIYDRHP